MIIFLGESFRILKKKVYSRCILFREMQCKKRDILMFSQRFSAYLVGIR